MAYWVLVPTISSRDKVKELNLISGGCRELVDFDFARIALAQGRKLAPCCFRALVGKGYQTLRSLLLDFCQWQPSEALLSTLLDMLVDGKFDLDVNSVIKNEDVILLYLSVLQKSSDSLQHHGLNMFLHLLRDSLSNQASCVRAGMLDFLLNWFSQDNSETIVWKISQLIQVIGGHSISGKDIRKIFALLRSENTGLQQRSSSLLLTSMLTMLNEKGPTAFFDLNGIDSGIVIKTPVPWPVYKGFSFTCWLRVENFPRNGPMGLFSFLMENGRGCYAVLAEDKLIYESINQKRQCVSMNLNLVRKKWHFFCLVHSVGRAFSGGSQLRCYLDGILVSSEKCRTRMSIILSKNSYPFLGQIGPTYLFSDAISSELVQGIYSLGPSYMYYFLDNEISVYVDNFSSGGASDAKDGLASKIIFGLNAQASDGRTLFNVSPIVDQTLDKKRFEATVLVAHSYALDGCCGRSFIVLGGVQRELYMFLLQQLDNDPRLLKCLCRLPRVLDIIRQFYQDNEETKRAVRSKSIGAYSGIDIKALLAFCETCQDMACIEDILNMMIRAVSHKQLLASFLEQLHVIGGCHIFVNLLSRLFKFPQTDHLCATLFDVLLGGASPKQVLRKHNQSDRPKNGKDNSQFVLPQVLSLIFRFLSGCEDRTSRMKIMGDLLDLLDSNPSNIEALMENGWNAWVVASMKLDVMKSYKTKMQSLDDSEMEEQYFVRNVYSLVLCHYMLSVKGGWQNLEETVNFLLIQSEQVGVSCQSFLRDLYEDLIQKLVNLSSEENVFVSQPCRDNTLYLVKLVDEMLISEMDYRLPFPASSSKFPQELENCPDFDAALFEVLQGEPAETYLDGKIVDEWWNIYDKLWIIISEMNGKGPSKILPRSSSFMVPSLGQRARGLVESLNIPAEMAAVVSGGISSALVVGKPNKTVDKAMLLRGERCSRFVYRLIILYLCRSSLERASQCVQQFIPILPFLLTADDEQSKSRLQLFIWSLLAVRFQYGMRDGGARFHVISSLIRETINCGKSMLATSIMGSDDLSDFANNSKEGNTIFDFIQKDRLLGAVADEVKYIKTVTADRSLQLDELRSRLEENATMDSNQKKAFEDQIQSSLNTILASDDSRRSLSQLTLDEDKQIVAEKWIHTLRLLIDERGPWSAKPFPNSLVTHWKLDKTEDGWRRRQKLRRNYHFNDKLCHPPSVVDAVLASTNDNKLGLGVLALDKMKQLSLKGIQRITDEGSAEPSESEVQSSQQRSQR
ncbi:UNVERIFIED_CONTAM: BEACH domain-containing protein B [Sesamum radiatum]|uniref:BEACH domain-containing protein B n=1 Tax=Sesamum radiatum TaxID=300843 RepID=A0AAW2SJV3_SESRA